VGSICKLPPERKKYEKHLHTHPLATMRCATFAASFLAAWLPTLALRRAADDSPNTPKDASQTEECRVPMRNNDEVDYTVEVNISGQVVHVIPDTGSFAMVLFSDQCKSCGQRKHLLHPSQLEHLRTGTHRAVQNYGSGETYSADAYAPTQISCGPGAGPSIIRAYKQMFWMTVKADLPVAEESNFQGILGLGPPGSDAKMAQLEVKEAKKEVAAMRSQGMDVDQYKPFVDNLEDVAKFTKTVKPWLENKGLIAFSVCLRNEPGREGTLIYNDRKSLETPDLFASIVMDTKGPYWQTKLSGLKLGGDADADRIRTEGSTQAILDTGTSLIGAPSWFVNGVVSFVSARLSDLGCDDVTKWPDLRFKLGGVELALPASSYLGKVVGDESFIKDDPRLFGRMPHLKTRMPCTAMIFSTTNDETYDSEEGEDDYARVKVNATRAVLADDTADSPEWIFGLPFFRTYYTTFLLTKDAMDARRVFLAEANEKCVIKGKPGSSSKHGFKRMSSKQSLSAPMAIDPRKLRFPPRGAPKQLRAQAAEVLAEA